MTHSKFTLCLAGLLCLLTLQAVPAQVAPASPSALPPVTAPPAEAAAPASLPKNVSLASPQETMTTFFEGMSLSHRSTLEEKQQGFAQALAIFPPAIAHQSRDARQQACEQLLGILDRLGTLELAQLPDATVVQAEQLQQYVLFPRVPEHDWVYEKTEPNEPKGSLILERYPDGQWRLSEASLHGLHDLHLSMVKLPKRHEAKSQLVELIAPTWQRTGLYGWLSLLVAIFMGVLGGKMVSSFLRLIAARLRRSNWTSRAVMFENASAPASLAVVTFGLAIGLQFIHLENDVFHFALRIIKFLYILALGWFLYNLIDLVDHWLTALTARTENKLDDMLVPLIRKTLRIFLVILFILVVAQNVLGLDITAWLAGLSIAGLAVSFAAQESIKNLFGSLTVFFDQPFTVGDFISIDGYEATVEEIGLRSTKMRTLDGHLVTVPNMKFTDSSVRNITDRATIRRVLDIGVTYDTPPEKIQQAVNLVKSLLQEPGLREAMDWEKLPPRVMFVNLGASSLNIRVFYWYTLADGRDYWSSLEYDHLFNMRLVEAFNQAGIEFAFPTQTLFLAGDPKRPLPAAVPSPSPSGRGQG